MSNIWVAVIMGTFLVSIIGVDIWLALDKRSGNTYSARLRAWGKVWPPFRLLVCFGLGLLAGHWWWSVTEYVNCGCP